MFKSYVNRTFDIKLKLQSVLGVNQFHNILVYIEQLPGVYAEPVAPAARKIKKLNLTATIESIDSLGAVEISFSDKIDVGKTKITNFDSNTIEICVKARVNLSPFGDLCGTSVDETPKKRELVAFEKRCLKT